ncbi:MAG: RidA family protein [Hyphomicrobiaceae bacterium]|nr:RidA family protein [Hyphomicrobiaceae bacterium]
MTVEPVHHVPMKPEFNSPFSAAYAVEGSRLLFLSGAASVPPYHKHPHDPEEEKQWLEGDFREQTELTFKHIREVLNADGADFKDVVKMTIYVTDMAHQNVLNEISAQIFGPENPPARTFVGVPTLAHPGLLIEIDVIAAIPPKHAKSR